MKPIATHQLFRQAIVLFFVLISFCSRAAEKAELIINISDCRGAGNYSYLSKLKILRNENEYKTIEPQHEKKQVLNDLEFGTYKLVYNSLYGKEVSLTVEITENKTYSIDLCTSYIDYSKETYIPIIDQLQVNERYTIVMSSQGCFHSTDDTLTIKRNKEDYTITWGAKTKKLSSADIELIRHFEIELNYMSDIGCTTTDRYTIKYKGRTVKQIDDGSCRWSGFYYLTNQLFDTK
ncbi:MAG: hypothetical protein ACRC3B_17800 [Bacteroidia bacterium]